MPLTETDRQFLSPPARKSAVSSTTEEHCTPYVESTSDLEQHASDFEAILRQLNTTIGKCVGEKDCKELFRQVRRSCEKGRACAECLLGRGMISRWIPDGTLKSFLLEFIGLFQTAIDLTESSRVTLERHLGHKNDDVRLVGCYRQSMAARLAIIRASARANDDGWNKLLLDLATGITADGSQSRDESDVTPEDLCSIVAWGTAIVSFESEIAQGHRYAICAALLWVQNLAILVIELQHEAGPYVSSLLAHERYAESMYDWACFIINHAKNLNAITADNTWSHTCASEVIERLEVDLANYKEDVLLKLQCSDLGGATVAEKCAEDLIVAVRKNVRFHYYDVVRFLKGLLNGNPARETAVSDRRHEALDGVKLPTSVRVLLFPNRRKSTELAWCAHCLELNLVAFAETDVAALEQLKRLLQADLEFRIQYGVSPHRKLNRDLAESYNDSAMRMNPSPIILEFSDHRAVTLNVVSQQAAS
jgi:hypothetical protein